MGKALVLVLAFGAGVFSLPSTTKSYDLEVPGKNPIRIYEAEPPWTTTTNQQKNYIDATTLKTKTNLSNPRRDNYEDDSITELPAAALEDFLKNYAQKLVKPAAEETVNRPDEARNRFGGYSQKQNRPFDDRKGWVSLEPVPWSVSKISKWQSHYKPQENQNPWSDDDSRPNFNTYKPYYKPKPTSYYTNQEDDQFFNSKPTHSAFHVQKVEVVNHGQRPHHQSEENCDHDGIITDGLPSNFPDHQEDSNRRRGTTETLPVTHPFSGDGEWVLLSTTKGYKYPKPKSRERSLNINADANSIGVHRSVRLTVLPPLKNSKVNMTTSHGGMLQVESTFQTVEQAQKQFAKKQKLKLKQKLVSTTRRPHKVLRPQGHSTESSEIDARPALSTTTVTRTNNAPDTSAVLAAVGAGMIPATMAMLLPIAMGGRRKRDTGYVTSRPNNIEMTLPRSL